MEDLLALLSRTHERLLDRSRPLWEWHLVEGLPRKRFATLLQGPPLADGRCRRDAHDRQGAQRESAHPVRLRARRRRAQSACGQPLAGWFAGIAQAAASLRDQGKAIPQLASMLMRMGNDGHTDSPPLPFTAPRATMNHEISHRRRLLTAQFPLAAVRRIGASVDGTINDALLAICGGGLRSYLLEQRKLPKQALLAGVPVSVRTPGEQHGNELSMIVCPLGTTARDPLARLRHISRSTRKAKQHLRELSPTARQDYMNMVLLPAVLLTVAGASTSVPPPFNVLVSNVPGPAGRLYMAGSRLEEIYPLSLVTDAQALNITAVSCGTKLCLGITACPDNLPQIEHLGAHLDAAYRELKSAVAP